MKPNESIEQTAKEFWIGFISGAAIIALASLFALPSFFSTHGEERNYAALGLGAMQIIGFFVVLFAACVASATGRHKIAQGLFIADLLPFLTCGICTVSSLH